MIEWSVSERLGGAIGQWIASTYSHPSHCTFFIEHFDFLTFPPTFYYNINRLICFFVLSISFSYYEMNLFRSLCVRSSPVIHEVSRLTMFVYGPMEQSWRRSTLSIVILTLFLSISPSRSITHSLSFAYCSMPLSPMATWSIQSFFPSSFFLLILFSFSFFLSSTIHRYSLNLNLNT